MYFELQFSAEVFTRVVRNRLRAIDLCPPEFPITGPPDKPAAGQPAGPGVELLIDQISIGDRTYLQRENPVASGGINDSGSQLKWTMDASGPLDSRMVPYMQVRQEVTVLLVRKSDVDKNEVKRSDPFPVPELELREWTIWPVFNVALDNPSTKGGGPLTLSYALAYIEYGPLTAGLTAAQRADIARIVGGIKIPPSTIKLDLMKKLVKRPITAINSGIACDTGGNRVALRVDFDVPRGATPAVTERFFTDSPDDLLAGKDWAMLVDADVLIKEYEPKVKSALQSGAGGMTVKIYSDPAGTWHPAEITLRFKSEIAMLGACPSFVKDIDMDIALDLAAHLAVPAPRTLQANIQLDHSLTDAGQVWGCALTGAVLFPFFGPALVENGTLDLLEFLGGVAFGPLFVCGLLIGTINNWELEDDISKYLAVVGEDSTCRKISNSQYECMVTLILPIEVVPATKSYLVLERAHGVTQGLVLSGTVAKLDDVQMGSLSRIDVSPFRWTIAGQCNSNRDGGGKFSAINSATITLEVQTPPGSLPARICNARILRDDLGVFSITFDAETVTVVATVSVSYVENPYPCVVRLITNRGGVRTLNLGIALERTADDEESLDQSLRRRKRFCAQVAKLTLPLDELYEVPNAPLPPVERFGVDSWILFRQLAIAELPPDSRAVLRSLNSEEALATAVRSQDGVAYLSVLAASWSPVVETHLQLEVHGSDRPIAQFPITRQEVLYARRTEVPCTSVPEGIRVRSTPGGLQVSVVGRQYESTWDVESADQPRLISQTPTSERVHRTEALVADTGWLVSLFPVEQTDSEIGQRNTLPEIRGGEGESRDDVMLDPVLDPLEGSAVVAESLQTSGSHIVHRLTEGMPVGYSLNGGNALAIYDSESGAVVIYDAVRVGRPLFGPFTPSAA